MECLIAMAFHFCYIDCIKKLTLILKCFVLQSDLILLENASIDCFVLSSLINYILPLAAMMELPSPSCS